MTLPNTATRLHVGDWLRRKHDHWDVIEVLDVTRDGGVRVRTLAGDEANTTVDYLRYQFDLQEK